MIFYKSILKEASRRLRNHMTDAEKYLWKHLRNKQILGVPFYRQKPLGPFIVDFYAPRVQLVIEVDGQQHLKSGNREYDQERDGYLAGLGLKILRFNNLEVLQSTDGVLKIIFETVSERLK